MRIRSSHSAVVSTPEEAASRRAPIGQVLDIGADTAEAVAERQRQTGRLFGETAVELGFVTPEQVRRAVERQQGFAVLEPGDARVDPLVVAAFDPNDPLSRVARDLRAQVTAATKADGGPIQSVALVGLAAEQEASLLASNLGVACAQAGYSTLLIDANLDEPHQHVLFRQPNRLGLSTLLSGGSEVDAATQPTAIEPLSLLSAGPAVPNALELLDRQRLVRAIRLLEDRFGLMIIDAAQAERSALAACDGVDAVLFVARRNLSRARALQNAAAYARRRGSEVLGAIMVD